MWLLGFSSICLGQTVAPVDSQTYRPPVDADRTLWADDAGLVRDAPYWGRYRIAFGYMNRPLIYSEGENQVAVVRDALQMNLTGSATFLGRVRLGVDLPVYLLSTSDIFDGSRAGLGDLAVDLRGTVIDRETSPVGLAAGLRFGVPTGSLSGLASDGLVWEAQAIVDRQFGDALMVSLNLGTRGRPGVALDNITLDDQFFARLGGGYDITDAVGVSVDLATSVNYAGGGSAGAPLEGMIGAWGRPFNSPVVVRGGVGTGLTPGIGAALARGVLMVGWEPEPSRDADGDGVLDAEDHCPEEPEDFDQYEDDDGCPELDNDGDGVEDVLDSCPLEAEDLDRFADTDGCPDPTTELSVRITDDQGRLLGQALVEILGKTDPPERHVEMLGSFRTTFHSGPHTVIAEADGFHERRVEVEIPPATTHAIEIALEPRVVLGQLAFWVQDLEGNEIEATWEVDGGKESVVPKDGAQISLVPGDHEVWVYADGFAPARLVLTVRPNEIAEITIMLEASKAAVVGERIDIQERVFFDSGKDSIKPVSYALLDEIASILERHPEIRRVRIEGHTDKVGSAAGNQRLSEKRAASVVAYLVSAGIEANRLVSEGLGESQPLVDGDTSEAYAQNRRVEFHIVERSNDR